MLDMANTRPESFVETSLLSTITAIESGMAAEYVQESGIGKSGISSGGSNNKIFAGVLFTSEFTLPTASAQVEATTVPATGPYTYTLAQTPVSPATALRIKTSDGNYQVYTAGTPSAGQFSVTGNVVTFNAAQASLGAVITYRYNVTIAQANQLFGGLDAFYGSGRPWIAAGRTGLIKSGTVHTTFWDPEVDWSVNDISDIVATANGFFSRAASTATGGGAATGASVNGVVTFVPTEDYPYLGLRFTAR